MVKFQKASKNFQRLRNKAFTGATEVAMPPECVFFPLSPAGHKTRLLGHIFRS